MKKVLHYIVIGLGIGSVVSTGCIALMDGMDSTLVQVFGWLAASALFGLVSLVYEIERIALPAQIGVHLLLCFGITLTTAWLLGYMESLWALAVGILPSFFVIYVVITAVALGSSAYTARKINEKLK